MYPLPGNGHAGTYIFPQIFRPFGQNYTIQGKIVMPDHTYIHFYIDKIKNSVFGLPEDLKSNFSTVSHENCAPVSDY
jgi:hypothetical protein